MHDLKLPVEEISIHQLVLWLQDVHTHLSIRAPFTIVVHQQASPIW
jgi:hypothetical protein